VSAGPGAPVVTQAAEATAPCRVDLAGGVAGVLTLTVAIDRRAWCRIEPAEGVHVESRDALRKASGRSVSELAEDGTLGSVARVLRAVGLETGARVVSQSRVPLGSGLGESAALAAAVAGAAAHSLGKTLDADEIARIAADAELPGRLRDGQTAVRGGALLLHPAAGGVRAEPLAVDPARVEESLLLVQCERSAEATPADPRVLQEVASRVCSALLEGRFEDVAVLWVEEWDARRGQGWPSAEWERVAGVVREAGGAARPCGGGEGGLLAVWAPPGAREAGRHEAVLEAAKAAGLRLFPARIDLRGLEVE
jgi:galactokinase/mevalonate kinase-like predicted kinase